MSAAGFAGERHALYAGTRGDGGTFRIALHFQGSKVTAEYAENYLGPGAARALEGTLAGSRVELATTGKVELRVELELSGDALTGSVTRPAAKTGSSALLGKRAAPLDAALTQSFEHGYAGTLGKNKPFRMKLVRKGAELTGLYRYGDSYQELTLAGRVEGSGAFELEERNEQGAVTGKLKGVLWDQYGASGTWWSPDESRTFRFRLSVAQEYAGVFRHASGARIYAVYRDYDKPSCTADVFFPQLVGTKKKALERAANELLRTLGQGQVDETFCAAETEAFGGPNDQMPWEAHRRYGITGARGPWIGLVVYQSAYTGGNHHYHELHCAVVDTANVRVFELIEYLPETAWPAFQAMARGYFDRDPLVVSLRQSGGVTPFEVTKQTRLCLNDDGVTIAFGDYELGAGYAAGMLFLKIPARDAFPHFDRSVAHVLAP